MKNAFILVVILANSLVFGQQFARSTSFGSNKFQIDSDTAFQNKADTSLYRFQAKLVESVPLPPDCGMYAFAVVHLFEVMETVYPVHTGQCVLIIEECPDFKGDSFFVAGKLYKINAAKNSGASFGFRIYNNYNNEHFPVFWSRQTELLNK